MANHLHIAWIHESPAPLGGCEHYIRDCAIMLRQHFNVRSTFLYGTQGWTDPDYMKSFDAAFPIVALRRQLADLQPDVAYVHRLPQESMATIIAESNVPSVRFFHDHKLFCLREHKYTVVGRRTCTEHVGVRCYPCGGFVQRSSEGAAPFQLRRLSDLRNEQRQSQGFDAYVVASHYMAAQVAANGFASDRTHVVPLYTAEGQANGVARMRNLLLFVGRLNWGKGVDLLLAALARAKTLPNLCLVGDGSQRRELEQQASDLGISERVEFRGHLDQQTIRRLYGQATWLALPTRTPETFGLVGIEALSHGTPVIATDAGGVGEWLLHGRTGISVPPNDVDALAAAIDTAFSNPAAARSLGRAGKKYCDQHFRGSHHAEALMGVFQDIQRRRVSR